MGWDYQYSWRTKQDVSDDLGKSFQGTDGSQVNLLDKAIRGNCLWLAWERIKPDGTKERVINLALLRYDRKDKCYGYKGMSESEHPYFYNCPKKLLDLVPEVANAEWRKRVLGIVPATPPA